LENPKNDSYRKWYYNNKDKILEDNNIYNKKKVYNEAKKLSMTEPEYTDKYGLVRVKEAPKIDLSSLFSSRFKH